jgi:hypothetical protein
MKFTFDPQTTPAGFDADAFLNVVEAELVGRIPSGPTAGPHVAAIVGMLSVDGFLTASEETLRQRVKAARFEADGASTGTQPPPPAAGQPADDPATIPHAAAYRTVARLIAKQPGRETVEPAFADTELAAFAQPPPDDPPYERSRARTALVYFEELAFVARRLISNSAQTPLDHPRLATDVEAALAEYGGGGSIGNLELPPLSGTEAADAELVPDNIRSVGLVYAAYQLEQVKLFAVVDRITEVFLNGMLPVGFDNGGRALDAYYWEGEDRLTEAARRMTYSRVLGVPGGQVSNEVQPNRAFEDLWMRFLASLSEYDRQRRIGDLFDGRQGGALNLTGEQVRKSGRDLAANASLYGWGNTHFAARRLSRQIERALSILQLREIQAAFGVQGPWQVVERVAAMDLGGAPNVVRHRTMADAGKRILDIVARNAHAWLGGSGDRPLFPDPAAFAGGLGGFTTGVATGAVPIASDISENDRLELMRQTEYWLAVNGVSEEQRDRFAEPGVAAPAPSIPTAAPAAPGSNAAFDQIRQMIERGEQPSMDQLRGLVPGAAPAATPAAPVNGVRI